jgi:outer membrane biosynthesis protein TonB
MPDLWYYEHEMKKCGPVTAHELRKIAATGVIRQTDTIWKEGVEKGVPAARVKNLFAPTPAAPVADGVAAAGTGEALGAGQALGAGLPTPPPAPPPPSEPATPAEPPAAVAAAPESAPAEVEKPPAPAPPKQPVKKARAVAVRGVVLGNQDGTHVQFKKKCVVCGHEDPNKVRVPIKSGINRISFFCTKCKKVRQAEFQGVL